MELKLLMAEGLYVGFGQGRQQAKADVVYGALGERDFAIYRLSLTGDGKNPLYIVAEGDDPYICPVREFFSPRATMPEEKPVEGDPGKELVWNDNRIKLKISLSVIANADIPEDLVNDVLEADKGCMEAVDYRAKAEEFNGACRQLFSLIA